MSNTDEFSSWKDVRHGFRKPWCCKWRFQNHKSMHTHQAHLIQADIKHIYQSERIFENIPALCLMFAKSCACCVYILSDMHLHKFEHWTFPKRYRTSLYDTMTFLWFNLNFDNPYFCFLLLIPPCVNTRLQSSQRWKKIKK